MVERLAVNKNVVGSTPISHSNWSKAMFELLVGTTWIKFDDPQRLFLEAKRLGAVKVIEIKDNLYIMKF